MLFRSLILPTLLTSALAASPFLTSTSTDECGGSKTSKATPVAHVETADIVDTAVAAGDFQTLAAALGAADLVTTLKGKGPFTVFAPTDEAFAALPEGTVANLLKPENKDALVNLLKHHVVAGRVYSEQAIAAGEAKTLAGTTLKLKVDDDGASIGGGALLTLDLDASNGVIYVVEIGRASCRERV